MLFFNSWGSWSGWKSLDDSIVSKELGLSREMSKGAWSAVKFRVTRQWKERKTIIRWRHSQLGNQIHQTVKGMNCVQTHRHQLCCSLCFLRNDNCEDKNENYAYVRVIFDSSNFSISSWLKWLVLPVRKAACVPRFQSCRVWHAVIHSPGWEWVSNKLSQDSSLPLLHSFSEIIIMPCLIVISEIFIVLCHSFNRKTFRVV